MPYESAAPSGRRGRRERESRRGGRRERSLRETTSFACVAVKGILVVGKAALFAGRRRKDGLGRSASSSGTSRRRDAPATADVRRLPRRGTSSACAIKRMHPRPAREIAVGSSGTRPSLGPSTRVRQSPLCCRRQNAVRWGVRIGIAVGQTCASRRNWHRGWYERALRGSPRATASARERAWRGRRGRGSRPPSLRGLKSSGSLPAGRTQLQKSVGDVWSRIRSANALQKERQGRVNGGLGRRARRQVILPPDASGEGTIRESASTGEITGEDRRRPKVARDRHPAVFPSPKAVGRSRGRGCNGHRILRRAPIDRRHPGSSRDAGFHETTSTAVWAARAPSDPYPTSQKETERPGCSAREGGRGERDKRGSRQGCQRFDRRDAVGRTRPRPRPARSRRGETRSMRSAEAASDVVKRPVPRSCRTEP